MKKFSTFLNEQNDRVLAAKLIRKELKQGFPGVKFSVTSESFAGGDAVRIDWDDGPTTKAVNDIVQKYQYGDFDGMEDIYNYSNTRDDIPQTKYVQTTRTISDEMYQEAFEFYKENLEDFKNINELSDFIEGFGNVYSYIRRHLWNVDLTNGLDTEKIINF